jgi:aspartokinase
LTDAYGQSLKTLSSSPEEVKKIVENYENASVVVVSSGITVTEYLKTCGYNILTLSPSPHNFGLYFYLLSIN